MAPISVEISTAGITTTSELPKYGFMPPQFTLTQTSLQAWRQVSSCALRGSAKMDASRSSSGDFSDVTTITYSGAR
jgi:hypothetical protein